MLSRLRILYLHWFHLAIFGEDFKNPNVRLSSSAGCLLLRVCSRLLLLALFPLVSLLRYLSPLLTLSSVRLLSLFALLARSAEAEFLEERLTLTFGLLDP